MLLLLLFHIFKIFQNTIFLRRWRRVPTVPSKEVMCVHFNIHRQQDIFCRCGWKEEKSVNSKRGKGKNTWGGKERGNLLSSFLALPPPPPTSPVSPIVLHHNRGCLIILKTADYQSGRFQGPTSKQTQQYRTEKEFLWTVWEDYKGHGFKGTPPPTSLSIPTQKHIGNAMLKRIEVMSGGGFEDWDAYQENMAASWKEK